jgi:endonuclease
VLRDQVATPTPQELLAFFERHGRDGAVLVQVVGEFDVAYVGRAASLADAGDYLVMLKPDGSLQVHAARGVKPVNWQPQVDELHVQIEDGHAVLIAERRSPEELVRIVFVEVALAQALALREGGGFVLSGSEAEMQRALASAPDVIEDGLTVLDVELPTDVGGIDLFARDAEGALLVVELKRGKATQEAVHQLLRYVERVRELGQDRVRGVLAAPAITAPALLALARAGLEYREVQALPQLEPKQRQPGLFADG